MARQSEMLHSALWCTQGCDIYYCTEWCVVYSRYSRLCCAMLWWVSYNIRNVNVLDRRGKLWALFDRLLSLYVVVVVAGMRNRQVEETWRCRRSGETMSCQTPENVNTFWRVLRLALLFFSSFKWSVVCCCWMAVLSADCFEALSSLSLWPIGPPSLLLPLLLLLLHFHLLLLFAYSYVSLNILKATTNS